MFELTWSIKSKCERFRNEFYHPFYIAIKYKKHYKIYKIKYVWNIVVLFIFGLKILVKYNMNANIHSVHEEELNIANHSTAFDDRL